MPAHPLTLRLRRIQDRQVDVATPDALVLRLERAIRRFRLQSAHNLLDEAFAAHPPETLLKQVGRPLLARLDDPATQRFATSLLELRLLAHARGWDRVNGPLTVLACAPNDDDVLPLIALGIGLAERGCCICYLGAATPVDALAETVRAQDAALAVLSIDSEPLTRYELHTLRQLTCPLITIGRARGAVSGHAIALDPEAPTTAARIAGLARRESSRRSDEPSPTRGAT